jgi:hypothetical protein
MDGGDNVKKENNKTRRLKVVDSRVQWMETIVIQHDIAATIREIRGEQEPERDESAEVIPFEPKK